MDDVTPRLAGLPTWLLGRAHARSHRTLGAALAALDLTGYQYRVLAVLGDAGSPAPGEISQAEISQIEIGRRADLDRSDVASGVDALEARGAVRRSPDPDDRRRNRVGLTAAGRRLLARADAAVGQAQEDVLAGLPAADRRRLVELLARLAG